MDCGGSSLTSAFFFARYCSMEVSFGGTLTVSRKKGSGGGPTGFLPRPLPLPRPRPPLPLPLADMLPDLFVSLELFCFLFTTTFFLLSTTPKDASPVCLILCAVGFSNSFHCHVCCYKTQHNSRTKSLWMSVRSMHPTIIQHLYQYCLVLATSA